MRTIIQSAVFGAAVALGSMTANATLIDTTSSDIGTVFQFGYPDSATYGQTFTVTGTDTVLDSFSLYVRGRYSGAGTVDLRGYIAAWDGSKASSILFESATQTMNAAATQQEFAFNTGGLGLLSGSDYVAFLSISNLGVQAESTFGMPYAGDEIAGNFVFLNNGTNFGSLTSSNWGTGFLGSSDAWFKASLSSSSVVPAPATLALFGLGLAGLGWSRRKKA